MQTSENTFAYEKPLILYIMKLKFYHCPICGNMMVTIYDSNRTPVCCGRDMRILTPKREEESYTEKHAPVVTKSSHSSYEVKIGAMPHPMTDDHYIGFVCIEMERRFVVNYLKPGDEPKLKFICKEKVVAAYAYCNKHGLWIGEPDD